MEETTIYFAPNKVKQESIEDVKLEPTEEVNEKPIVEINQGLLEKVKHETIEFGNETSWTSEEPLSGLKQEVDNGNDSLGDSVYTELLTSTNQAPLMTNQLKENGFDCPLQRMEFEAPTCDVIIGIKSDKDYNSIQESNFCSKCNKTFTTKHHLKKHILSVHEKFKPYKCAHCGYTCCKKSTLSDHVMSIHEQLKPFKCADCETPFSQKRSLYSHINSVHKKLKPFKCIDCDNAFRSKSDLTRHIKCVHLKLKPIKCLNCDYVCSLNYQLSAHISTAHSSK